MEQRAIVSRASLVKSSEGSMIASGPNLIKKYAFNIKGRRGRNDGHLSHFKRS